MNIAGGNYYCLIAGLPEISPDDKKLSLSVQELRTYLNDYLTKEEVDTINLFFYPNDNAQIIRLLQKQEPDNNLQTVFTASQLEDEIQDPMFTPSYIKEYLLDLNKEDKEKNKTNILYEDEDLIFLNKPKDMVVHPAQGHYTNTLVNALLYHCGDSLSGINGVIRPGIVHRIDKDTTGSLIICKNDRKKSS